MMYFGWRPQASCYTQDGVTMPTTTQQTANCESPTWWYLLLAASAVAGLAVRKKK